LTSGTGYYVRVYATNSYGNDYGKPVFFTTNGIGLTTQQVNSITSITASGGGNITTDGGEAIIARGICWSTSPNPTTALSTTTTEGSGVGSFASSMTGLTDNTLYYVRAYATSVDEIVYGNEVSFKTKVTDIDGNLYNTVTIGAQTWLKENLKTTRYNNGTAIPDRTINAEWQSYPSGAYCDYNITPAYSDTYGRLYNWYAVNTGNLCPTGWHVPTDAEWTAMVSYLNANGYNYNDPPSGDKIAIALAATTNWDFSSGANTPGNTNEYPFYHNKTGFTALPGGYRVSNGLFGGIGFHGYWWSDTANDASNAKYFRIQSNWNSIIRGYDSKVMGCSVRCVRYY
jgi:uncharacterized protein (TIGR02145 family)